ncbi:beta-propeller domain-containing protein [Alteromonas gracilis]|uniref:beta-propeller domain-containing protein n=1 Tax=Alteromonas gracilis TaxID=1479524 RepID=UPI0037358C85
MKSKHGIDKISKCMAVLIFSTCIITACSSGDNDEVIEQPPQLSLTTNSDTPLGTSPNITASEYVKNGLYIVGTRQVTAPIGGELSTPASEKNFSLTNTQIEGVDEVDRIKYDGDYVYVANLPELDEQKGYVKNLRILKRQNDFALKRVAELPLASERIVSGLYLNENYLSVISSFDPGYITNGITASTSPSYDYEDETFIDIINVARPEFPERDFQIQIDGRLISSRKIGNHLYLAIQYLPSMNKLPAVDNSPASLLNFYKHIQALDNEFLVPEITINDQSLPLYTLDECLIPENSENLNGHTQLVSFLKIDMTSPLDYSALCAVVEAQGLFMSHENVYLHAEQEEETIFHKISFANGLEYQATGKVAGTFGFRSTPQLKMAEREGHFIALTTKEQWSEDPEHHLHVLKQEGQELVEVASLPNSDNPSPIGKPGEDVYAVRFFDDKAYVVTFERFDPLYVIDLSDLEAPTIQGELIIPEFSNYLHPMENGLLLGIGQRTSFTAQPVNDEQPATTPIEDGIRVRLFDVLDPENPVMLDEFVWPDSYTGAEYDYRSLSVLKTSNGYRFSLPLETWSGGNDGWSLTYSLKLLEVDNNTRSINLENSMTFKYDEENYYSSYDDRSILHGDHVYYLRGNAIYHTKWQKNSPVDGPF